MGTDKYFYQSEYQFELKSEVFKVYIRRVEYEDSLDIIPNKVPQYEALGFKKKATAIPLEVTPIDFYWKLKVVQLTNKICSFHQGSGKTSVKTVTLELI